MDLIGLFFSLLFSISILYVPVILVSAFITFIFCFIIWFIIRPLIKAIFGG